MANEIQYRNHTAYNNGTSAENNIKLLDITPFQHEDLSSGVNKLGKMLVAQSFCEPVAVCNSNNPQNGAYVATCQNYPDFALSYQDAQQNTQYLIGLKIRVIFTHGITYGSVSGGTYPTLNINGSGAIPMLAQGKTMATGSASAGQTLEFTVIPYGNGIAFDADSNVRESTSDYTIYTDGTTKYNKSAVDNKFRYIRLANQGNSSSRIYCVKNLHINKTSKYYNSNIYALTGRSGELGFLQASIGDQIYECSAERLRDGGKLISISFDSTTGYVYITVGGYGCINIQLISGDQTDFSADIVSSIPSSASAVTIKNVTLT